MNVDYVLNRMYSSSMNPNMEYKIVKYNNQNYFSNNTSREHDIN